MAETPRDSQSSIGAFAQPKGRRVLMSFLSSWHLPHANQCL